MKTVHLYKAQSARDPVESITLVFDEYVPQFSFNERWVDEARARFTEQGEELAAALLGVLPGGTVDQLLVALLRHRASVLVVKSGAGT